MKQNKFMSKIICHTKFYKVAQKFEGLILVSLHVEHEHLDPFLALDIAFPFFFL